MLARPTTDHLLLGIIDSLNDDVLPALTDEPARVAVQMMQQLLHSAATRAAHEIAWMAEEVATIRELATEFDDGRVRDALAALDELDATSLHLADAQARYDRASEVLSRCIDVAYASGSADQRARVNAVLDARSAHEMEIVGQFDLVGRG